MARTSVALASSTTAGTRLSLSARLLEDPVERLVLLGRVGGQVDEGLGSAIAMPAIVVEHASPHCSISRLLLGLANGGPDRDPLGVGILAVGVEHDLPGHFGDGVRVGGQRVANPLADRQLRILGVLQLRIADEAQFVHAPQHVELPRLGALGVGDGIVGGRSLGQSRQHGGFGDGDILQRTAEIDLRGGGEAIGALAEEDLVDVELEDLVLGQVRLDFPGQQHLPQFPGHRLLAGQEEVAGHLHGDRAGSLLGSRRQIRQGRPRDT